MRKGLLIGIVTGTIAIAAAAAPPIIGTITEREFANVRDRVTTASPFVHAWRVTTYDQGYLRASATSELTLGHPDSNERMTIVLDHDIRHAPNAGTDLAHVETVPRLSEGEFRNTVRALYDDGRAPLQVDTRIDWLGHRTIHAHSPPTDGMREIDGGRVDWRGLDATIDVGRGERDLAYRIDMPGLRLRPAADPAAAIRIEGVQAHGRYAATAFEHVWSGGASGRIERIELGAPDGDGFVLADLRFSDEARLRDDLFGFGLKASAAALETPDYTFSRLRLNLGGERIAPEFLRTLQQPRGDGDAPVDTDAMMDRLRAAPWGDIAAREPEMRLDTFEAHTENGRLEITARAGLAAPAEDQQGIGLSDLMALVQGEINAVAPEGMVVDAVARSIAMRGDTDRATAERNANNTLLTLAAQGLLTIEDGQVEASASYDRGAIRINGRSLFGGQ
jgi:uncharacterized protein YdgA (DUF945 family)